MDELKPDAMTDLKLAELLVGDDTPELAGRLTRAELIAAICSGLEERR